MLSTQTRAVGLLDKDSLSVTLDSNKISYDFNIVFQYGGEAKLTAFFPKINILRKHNWQKFTPYYGMECGLHPLLITAAYNGSIIWGIEKGIFNLENSLSYTRFLGVHPPQGGNKIPHAQSLLNIKAGIGYKGIRIKLGRSITLWENIHQKQNPIPFFDIGKVNGRIYGIELQFRLNELSKS